MSDISIRSQGRAGRITLSRPKALNALSYDMCLAIEAAIDRWRTDDAIEVIILDAQGDKAFCAGGDIAELYETGTLGNYAYGQKFWADEYRLNNKLRSFPKPIVSFMQGFTMGGGVGIGCHGSHRIVCENSQIAMPECGIGLVPDVGGSYILAKAPGYVGAYLGLTAYRMNAADAIFAGFADHYIPRDQWDTCITSICDSGDTLVLNTMSERTPTSALANRQEEIDAIFCVNTLLEVIEKLEQTETELAQEIAKSLQRNSPLAMAAALAIISKQQAENSSFEDALKMEYRFTYRAMEHGDFLEGIRAAIIDKDRAPKWRQTLKTVSQADLTLMTSPLGHADLSLTED